MPSTAYLTHWAGPWRTWPWWSTTSARSGRLLGLYEGVPLTRRGNHYSASTPDRITIYMATICGACQTTREVVELVRKTVIHEIGHHFGIDDQRLKELGWA